MDTIMIIGGSIIAIFFGIGMVMAYLISRKCEEDEAQEYYESGYTDVNDKTKDI